MEHVYYPDVIDQNQSPSYEQGTGFLLARLGAMAERSWSALLSNHGLTQAQYAVLMVLAQGSTGQGRLADLIAVDPRNVVAIVNGLETRGLVKRHLDPDDGRRRQIRLTREGRSMSRAIAREARSAGDAFLNVLNDDDRTSLNRILRRLYTDLVARDDAAG
jgi:DNA-binding MarR family transcriptional regulator